MFTATGTSLPERSTQTVRCPDLAAPANPSLAAPAGVNRRACDGTLITFRDWAVSILAVAVIPGLSRNPGLATVMTTS